MEHALCYDQLQVCELASLELVLRKAQLVELKHRDRIVHFDRDLTVDDDEHLYLGTGKTRGLLMIAQALEDYVSGELQRETAASKERRKMREERDLKTTSAPSNRNGQPKGGAAGRGAPQK